MLCFQVLRQTQDHSITQLEEIAGQIETWKQKVVKIKSIFHTMNKFNLDVTARCLIAECWCPVEDLEAIQQALMRGTVSTAERWLWQIDEFELMHPSPIALVCTFCCGICTCLILSCM